MLTHSPALQRLVGIKVLCEPQSPVDVQRGSDPPRKPVPLGTASAARGQEPGTQVACFARCRLNNDMRKSRANQVVRELVSLLRARDPASTAEDARLLSDVLLAP